ncbi:transposase [Corallococcus sp. 4LFB]|uniref:transposase n=1 Tax=Corallococcus sp. 4LFB TaxID=3383249 RepID=UPI003974E2CF
MSSRSTASFFLFAENRPRSAVLSCFCCFFTSTSRGGGYPPERCLKKSWGGGNAVIWGVKTGVQWRDLPERFGHWKTVYNRFHRWA